MNKNIAITISTLLFITPIAQAGDDKKSTSSDTQKTEQLTQQKSKSKQPSINGCILPSPSPLDFPPNPPYLPQDYLSRTIYALYEWIVTSE